jgi:hypothetical protein
MKALGFALVLGFAGAAPARAEPPAAPPKLSPIDFSRDRAWADWAARMAAPKTVEAPFAESRYFAFRRKPVALKGEIRIAPGRGLSLDYETPQARCVIVDDRGVLLRDPEGQRAVPSNDSSQAMTESLLRIIRFDLPGLENEFQLRGWKADGDWELVLTPRQSGAGGLKTIVISGHEEQLREIQLIHSGDERIQVLIGPPRRNAVFSEQELNRYFR